MEQAKEITAQELEWRKIGRPWAYQFLRARFGGWTAKAMPKYRPALKWLKNQYFTDRAKFDKIIHGINDQAGAVAHMAAREHKK